MYLRELTLELIRGKVIRRRLHYDKLTWPGKYQQIQACINATRNDFTAIDLAFDESLKQGSFASGQMYSTTKDGLELLHNLMRQCIGSMLDVHQVVGREIQHTAHLIHGYFRNDVDERRLIHARYMKPLRARLQGLRSDIDTLQGVVNLAFQDGQQLPWETCLERKWRRDLQGQPRASLANLDIAQAGIAQAAADIRHLVVGFASIRVTLDQLIGMLHDAYIDDNVQNLNGSLDAVKAAKNARSLSQMIEVAANREMAAITNIGLLNLIQSWYNCILAYQRESQLRGQTRAELAARRAQAQDEYLQALAHIEVDMHKLPLNVDESQQALMEAETLERLRNKVAADPDLQP